MNAAQLAEIFFYCSCGAFVATMALTHTISFFSRRSLRLKSLHRQVAEYKGLANDYEARVRELTKELQGTARELYHVKREYSESVRSHEARFVLLGEVEEKNANLNGTVKTLSERLKVLSSQYQKLLKNHMANGGTRIMGEAK